MATALHNATLEKYQLLQQIAEGRVSTAQVGKKIRAIDDKYRSKKAVLLGKVSAFLALILAPFVVSSHNHTD
jgi:hypothetical protein